MTQLHMETDSVRELSRMLMRVMEALREQTQSVTFSTHSMDWQGGGKEEFQNELLSVLRSIESVIQSGVDLATRVGNEVVEWEATAAAFGSGSITSTGTMQSWAPSIDGQIITPGATATNANGSSWFSTLPVISILPILNQFPQWFSNAYKSNTIFLNGFGESSAVDPSDVSQGKIGDCYLMASMAEVAQKDPEIIKEMIKYNDDGTYTVTLYQKDEDGILRKTYQIIDDNFPGGVIPKYAQPGDYGIEKWPMLIEKAYAQMNGSYQNIDGGHPAVALEAITGVPSSVYSPTDLTIQELDSKFSVGAITVGTLHNPINHTLYENQTLVARHAYFVSKIDVAKNTVTIRNPWGWDCDEVTLDFKTFQTELSEVDYNSLY